MRRGAWCSCSCAGQRPADDDSALDLRVDRRMGAGARLRNRARHAQPALADGVAEEMIIEEQIEIVG